MASKIHFVYEEVCSDDFDTFLNSIEIHLNNRGFKQENYQQNKKDYYITVDFQMIYIYEGALKIIVNDREYVCTKGDVFIIPPYCLREISCLDENPSYYCWFHFDLKPFYLGELFFELISNQKNYLIKKDKLNPSISHYFEALVDELNSVNICSNIITKNFLNLIIANLIRENVTRNNLKIDTMIPTKQNNDLILKATHYIESHLQDDMSITSIANHCHISSSYLFKVFIKTINISPNKYIQLIKARATLILLESDKYTLFEISQLLGFHSYQAFNYFFKRWYNLTPTEYRKKFFQN